MEPKDVLVRIETDNGEQFLVLTDYIGNSHADLTMTIRARVNVHSEGSGTFDFYNPVIVQTVWWLPTFGQPDTGKIESKNAPISVGVPIRADQFRRALGLGAGGASQ